MVNKKLVIGCPQSKSRIAQNQATTCLDQKRVYMHKQRARPVFGVVFLWVKRNKFFTAIDGKRAFKKRVCLYHLLLCCKYESYAKLLLIHICHIRILNL